MIKVHCVGMRAVIMLRLLTRMSSCYLISRVHEARLLASQHARTNMLDT